MVQPEVGKCYELDHGDMKEYVGRCVASRKGNLGRQYVFSLFYHVPHGERDETVIPSYMFDRLSVTACKNYRNETFGGKRRRNRKTRKQRRF